MRISGTLSDSCVLLSSVNKGYVSMPMSGISIQRKLEVFFFLDRILVHLCFRDVIMAFLNTSATMLSYPEVYVIGNT